MKSPTLRLVAKARRCLPALFIALLSATSSFAQTIPNPSFETDTFTNGVGYISQNTNITDWNTAFPNSVGLNTSAGPFADNGVIPSGSNVAFIQSAGGTSLSTTVTGLIPGTLYKGNFRANARNGPAPLLRFSTDGIGDTVETRIFPVGGANPYRSVGFNFTATDTSNIITITNNQGGDTTVLIDDFSIAPSTQWSFSPWTGDVDSGIEPNYCYTHAYTLGGGAVSTMLNGVGFLAAGGGNPVVAGKFSINGLENAFGELIARNLTGASNAVGRSFIYGGPNMSITLTGLKPNTSYVATIFGVNFDGPGGDRTANFSSSLNPSDAFTVNLDYYGASNGIRVNYAYTTDATGTVTINYQQTADASWHTSAFANREAAPLGNWSRHVWNGDSTSGVDGTATYTHAYNFGSGDSPTINGIPFTGVAGANPSAAGFSYNAAGVFNNHVNTVTGDSATLAKDFVYGDDPGVLRLSGLNAGESYVLTLFAVGFGGPDGGRVQTFSGDAGSLVSEQNFNGNANGVRFDYRYIADSAGQAIVAVKPTTPGSTFHCNGFCNRSIAAIPTPVTTWQRSAWTDDATSGVVGNPATYTHAYNFGSAASPVVNGVTFTGIPTTNPSASNFTTTGLDAGPVGDAPNITGDSAAIGNAFVYNGNPATLSLAGLTPGETYNLTLFSVAWDPAGRWQAFHGPNGVTVVDQDAFGDNNGIRLDHQYRADAAGRATITISQGVGGSFHFYGFCNRLITPFASPPAWVSSPWTGNATSALTTAGVYTHAYNLGDSVNVVVNNVGLTGVGGADPSAANFTTQNFNTVFTGFGNNVGNPGASNKVASDFVYNGYPGGLNLTGLTPGTQYILSLYLVGFGPPGGRLNMLNGPAGCAQIDENFYGSGNGQRVDYFYTADATGTLHLTTNPQVSGSLHLHGFANREAALLPVSPPNITVEPVGGAAGLGKSFTFSVGVIGTETLHYQWRFEGVDIPGATESTYTVTNLTFANDGNYSVFISNDFGDDTSIDAPLDVKDNLAGLFDTGMGQNCVVGAGGSNDPHYTLIINADGAPIPAIVGAVLPSPPWVLNTETSKWIGPRDNTAGAAGLGGDGGAGPGTYVYRTTVDLTGFTLASVTILGQYAFDNFALDILVNGTSTGISSNNGFVSLSTFTLNSGNCTFVSGVNTIDFVVQNSDAVSGFTGLRVVGLQGYGDVPAGTAPHIAVHPADITVEINESFCLSVSANGSADLTYQWFLEGNPIPGATSSTYMATFTGPAETGHYTVRVTNGAGSVLSNPASVGIANVNPVANTDGTATSINTVATISIATVLSNDTDADMDTLTISNVSATSVEGGYIEVIDNDIYYVPATDFVGEDSFTYEISDGSGGTDTGTIQVRVVNGEVPGLGEVIYPVTAGTQSLLVGVEPGESYIFQRSTDLLVWEDLGTFVAPPTGLLDFNDPSPLVERRFYRAKKVIPTP